MALTQIQQELSDAVNKVVGFFSSYPTADIETALKLAQTSGDTLGAAAWTEIQKLSLQPIPEGAGVAYAIQLARSFAIQQATVNSQIGPVFPQFVLLYNQAVSSLYNLAP
jgi:hypothetical protein